MRAREIGGRPVVTLDAAEAVAEVKDVLFSHASTSVVGFTLNKPRLPGLADEGAPALVARRAPSGATP